MCGFNRTTSLKSVGMAVIWLGFGSKITVFLNTVFIPLGYGCQKRLCLF